MPRTRIRRVEVLDILRSLRADRRLVAIVRTLTKEIERLDEDNAQLHASVQIYKEIIRRGTGGPALVQTARPARDAA